VQETTLSSHCPQSQKLWPIITRYTWVCRESAVGTKTRILTGRPRKLSSIPSKNNRSLSCRVLPDRLQGRTSFQFILFNGFLSSFQGIKANLGVQLATHYYYCRS
jgi:hypothetical protein